jgi:hypothetical protein
MAARGSRVVHARANGAYHRAMPLRSRPAIAALLLAVGAATAHAQKSLVGVLPFEPGIVHPMVLERLPPARALEGLELGLHERVPLRITLTRGRRAGEYAIEGEPKLGITKLILPGLINSKLRNDDGSLRPVRFAVGATTTGGLSLRNCWSTGRVGRTEVAFVDLDHDGALGSTTDGYVVKAPDWRQWFDRDGGVVLRQMIEPLEIGGAKLWFEVDAAGSRLIVSDREPDRTMQRAFEYQKALSFLNELRRQLGHAPVTLDPELSLACEQHALYCVTNGALRHEQDRASPDTRRRAPRPATPPS